MQSFLNRPVGYIYSCLQLLLTMGGGNLKPAKRTALSTAVGMGVATAVATAILTAGRNAEPKTQVLLGWGEGALVTETCPR